MSWFGSHGSERPVRRSSSSEGGRLHPPKDIAAMPPTLTARTFRSPRHTTRYWEAGPGEGPLMVFVRGWPEIGLMWRAQMEAFAAEGWRCVAPDMRGYGGSSAPPGSEAYALSEIVEDMVELHEHCGSRPAVWGGERLGSPGAEAGAATPPQRE